MYTRYRKIQRQRKMEGPCYAYVPRIPRHDKPFSESGYVTVKSEQVKLPNPSK